jgi:DNA-binding transcriptional regulator YiaG
MKRKQIPEHNMGPLLGLPRVTAVLARHLPVVACTKCDHFLVPGPVVETVARAFLGMMLEASFPLTGGEIRFLRKAVGLTQEKLAERLGVDRVTVARWETRAEDEPVSAPESIAIRSVVAASEMNPIEAAPREALRARPAKHPRKFVLDALKVAV